MATTLDKPLIRETGLKRDDRDVFVVLMPSDDGGTIAFKEKGKHGQGAEVPLSKVMELALEGQPQIESKAVNATKRGDSDATGDIDVVDLAILEARLMIANDPILTDSVQGKLFDIIREMREEVREDVGLPRLAYGTRAFQAKEKEA